MKVLAGRRVVAMPMHLSFKRDWNEAYLTMRDATLRDNARREIAHRLGPPTQHRHLETVFMVEMHMHRCHMEMMMLGSRRSAVSAVRGYDG